MSESSFATQIWARLFLVHKRLRSDQSISEKFIYNLSFQDFRFSERFCDLTGWDFQDVARQAFYLVDSEPTFLTYTVLSSCIQSNFKGKIKTWDEQKFFIAETLLRFLYSVFAGY
eukprot:TRINITY_DN14021_c1_g1_i1.p4 TRINITY_DN14021_c1_g1~~TRINITY_DN14021_c1_g1_i1.p4  ORF type:complete len:115 (+),score=1.67 TRINITY_DN14021_c1_g1_i1:118-462(+)